MFNMDIENAVWILNNKIRMRYDESIAICPFLSIVLSYKIFSWYIIYHIRKTKTAKCLWKCDDPCKYEEKFFVWKCREFVITKLSFFILGNLSVLTTRTSWEISSKEYSYAAIATCQHACVLSPTKHDKAHFHFLI